MPGAPPHDDLVLELYDLLRRRARRLVAHEGGSVAPTSLVHEAIERIYEHDPARWRDRIHFKATAALAMRQILRDRVKAKGRIKRWGQLARVPLDDIGEVLGDPVDAIDLHDALDALDAVRPRAREVLELRLLGGLELVEVALHLQVSDSTVKREWRAGRAFVIARLRGLPPVEPGRGS